jgi:hypothetical protein
VTLSRRALIGGAAFLSAAAPSVEWRDMADRWVTPLRRAAPGLLRSYDVRTGPDAGDFDRAHAICAYVYDNALVALALLAAGDAGHARAIGRALADAQDSDRFWHDGRLRNAYAAGPMSAPARLPGWWDADRRAWLEDGYQAGTATGVLAWAMLLWTTLGPDFRPAADRAADWIAAHVRGASGFTGGVIGFEPTPQPLTWTSSEHNLDLAVVLHRLGRPEAAFAAAFVERMFDPAEGRFFSGLKPDGSSNPHSAIDANIWPLLAGGTHAAALDWVLSRHGLPAGAPRGELDGVDFNTDRDGIWLEGTAITALALRRAGDDALAARFGATLAANTAPSGLIYACTTPTLTTGLSTGLDPSSADFLYYRRPHIAPTAWAVLAALGVDPFLLGGQG